MEVYQRRIKLKYAITIVTVSACLAWYYFALPARLFNDPYSTVLLDKSAILLGARIAEDGQWRFPGSHQVPEKFTKSLLLYEDRYFYQHPGVNPLAFARALKQNIKAGRVISGGSTLSMQVIRLHRKRTSRTVIEKIIESILATRLELKYSKDEILTLYAAHAPFGGNIVGLDAACWRYFGRDAEELSWAEAALLAVLPNNPSLIHPGKNRELLFEKRNNLLTRLYQQGSIDHTTWQLALVEPLPEKPLPLPALASHLMNRAIKEGYAQQKLVTYIDAHLQELVDRTVNQHHVRLSGNEIWNAAALVLKTSSGNVLAYVGNANASGAAHDHQVDVIDGARSTGSILKPFLFAAMLDEGMILSGSLLPDVPTVINGFAPKNFSRQYDGAVSASAALVRSLNVPAVHMLKDYRYERFHALLKKTGMQTLQQGPDHYGLSLILGGAEARLWELSGMYASMGRVLLNYFKSAGSNRYNDADYHPPIWLKSEEKKFLPRDKPSGLLSASAIWQTIETLTEVNRPDEESGWKNFSGSQRIAWKTGTSYGFRDAWALGLTPDYMVAVWVGNANGEGRPGLTGAEAAAPLMFDIFSLLPAAREWFITPHLEMKEADICIHSGNLAGPYCSDKRTEWLSIAGLSSAVCTHHRLVHLSMDESKQVNANCERADRIKSKSWFFLPPVQEYYYRSRNPVYKTLPPFKDNCYVDRTIAAMDIIYPREDSRIFIPRQLDGSLGSVTFQIAHNSRQGVIFWHLDGEYLGSTQRVHKMSLHAKEGKHFLVLVDENGETLSREFEVVSSM